MKIIDAEFTASATDERGYPLAGLPEVVLIGRSNVGKSSLINCLVNRRKLARTSSTPGKTQTVNFYRLNRAFYLVDLPGFGYARVPRRVRKAWGPMVDRYMAAGRRVAGALVVLDIRRRPGEVEAGLYEWLEGLGVGVVTVLTKADKFSQSRRAARVRELKAALPGREVIVFSAKTGLGKAVLLKRLEELIRASGEKPLGTDENNT